MFQFSGSCFRYSGRMEKVLVATSTTTQDEYFTRWYPATGVDSLRLVMKGKQISTTQFNAQLIIQTANVRPDDPNAAAVLGTNQTLLSTFEYATGAVSVTTASVGWFRVGVRYFITAPAAVGSAQIAVEATWNQLGMTIGARSIQIVATDTSLRFWPISRFVPMIYAAKLKALIVINSLNGANLNYQLVYRTAATSVQQAGSWNTGFDALTQLIGNVERCSTDTAPTASSDAWIQLGVGAKLSAAGASANAQFHAMAFSRL